MPYFDKERKKWRARVERSEKVRTRFFGTQKEASQWEEDLRELPLFEFLNGPPTVYSLVEWSERYLDEVKQKCSAKTYQEKRLAYRMLFESVPKHMYPEQLFPGSILTHFNLQAKERSGYAANKDRKNLVAAWNWAKVYLPGWPKVENPFTVAKQSQIESPRYVPPEQDFWMVYDSLPMGQDKVMLFTYLHTAARRGELFRLKWNEIDFAAHRLKLWTRKRKGGLEYDWVPMTSELDQMLLWWRDNRTFPDSPNVFVCESGVPCQKDLRGQPFAERQKWLGHLCEKVGIQSFGIHAIRHLSASILDDAGYPITIIQGILRHKNANTTAKYLHKLRGMRVALDDAFRRKPLPEPASTEGLGRKRFRVIAGGRL
ncbi:MAG: tyrosine-type recombinase/integrase [Syntrophobacteraceae bacterium]